MLDKENTFGFNDNNELYVYRLECWINDGGKYHIFKCTNQSSEKPHTHDFIEIVYILDGSAEEKVNGETYTVKRGDVIFINYGCRHEFTPIGEFSYINICFRPETVGDSLITAENAFALLQLTAFDELRRDSEGGMVTFNGAERDELESLLFAMHNEYRNKSSFRDAMLDSFMNIILLKILRKTLSISETDDKDGEWRGILDYIDQNLGEELTLATVARKCFYNPSYFSRIFKEHFGISLTEYVSKRRIDAAIKLLTETDLSVSEIAERTGYPSKSSFYRVFARVTGTTPSEYRTTGER